MTSLLLLRVILEFFRGIVRSKRESELSESAQVDETLYEQITTGSPAQIKWHTGGCGWVLQVRQLHLAQCA